MEVVKGSKWKHKTMTWLIATVLQVEKTGVRVSVDYSNGSTKEEWWELPRFTERFSRATDAPKMQS